MKLRFITPATTAHVHQSTARTVTIARAAGSLSFSAALVRALGLAPGTPGATLTEDEDAPGSWYAVFGSTDPAHDCRPLRGKMAGAGHKPSQALSIANSALARELLASHQVPQDTNRLVLQVLPEPLEFDGLTLWPLRIGQRPAPNNPKEVTKALTKTEPTESPKAPVGPTISPVAAGPARPVASIPDASTERLQQRREHLLGVERIHKPDEVKELNKLAKELQKRGVLAFSEMF